MSRINVTKTFLPPMDEYEEYLKGIWDNNWLTNQGPLLQEFQKKVTDYLGVKGEFHLVSNGTIALQLALHALDIDEGEVITTPFSYVATASAILWQRCQPVFVDIDENTFCIDPDKIEAAITDKTKAIMPVHVFGNACDVEKIQEIANRHGLKVIYDAAHAFGVKYKGKSILDYGDISICSFHSTKLFHTIEGGALVVKDGRVSQKVELIKRFGHNNDDHYMLGINGKANEFQAAMGLCNLKYIDGLIEKRRQLAGEYDRLIGQGLRRPIISKDIEYNFAYYPVVFESEERLKKVFARLAELDIYPRRYFFPSLNTLPYIKGAAACPVSEDISKRVASLPFYPGLELEAVNKICEVLTK